MLLPQGSSTFGGSRLVMVGGLYLVWVTQVLAIGGGEVLGEVLAKVSGLPTLGGSKWRAGSRRYLVERVTRIVPGTVFCTPNFRRLLQRKCPNQVLGPKVLQCLVCRLQGEYVSNLLIAWFCTGCGSGMGLRLLPRIMETSAESSLLFIALAFYRHIFWTPTDIFNFKC